MEIPDLLTVEEAARLARIGRTKAYAMAREWRETGGQSGLPVVDFGNVLRVPRRALEALIGAELTAFPSTTGEAAPNHADRDGARAGRTRAGAADPTTAGETRTARNDSPTKGSPPSSICRLIRSDKSAEGKRNKAASLT